MQYTDFKFELAPLTPTPLYPNFNLERPDSWGGDSWEWGESRKRVRWYTRSTNGVIYTGGSLI